MSAHTQEMAARRVRQWNAKPTVVLHAMPHKRRARLAIVRPDQERRRAEREALKQIMAFQPKHVSKHQTKPGQGKGRGVSYKLGGKLYRVGGLRP